MLRWHCFLLCCCALAQDRGPLNEHTPKWLTLGAHTRFRAEGAHGLRYIEGNNADFLLHRYRLSVNLKPVDWIQLFGELQDARVAGMAPDASVQDLLDVRQAYVLLGGEKDHWEIKAGRQKFSYGTERMIGGAEWGNTARVFDAVKLGLKSGADRVDIFASSVVVNDVDHWDHRQGGNNLHGVYASIASLVPAWKIEPYSLMRTNPRAVNDSGIAGKAHSYTFGTRAAGSVKKIWIFEADAQVQRGSVASTPVRAWAAMINVQRILSQRWWQPALFGEYSFATGDRRPRDGVVNTLDQYYPTNHYFYGIADLLARRNAKAVRTGLILKPRPTLNVRAEVNGLWLASRYDALYAANGSVSVPAIAGGASHTRIGQEYDFIAQWKPGRYYDLGGQIGYLTPGPFLKAHTPGAPRLFYGVYFGLQL